MTAALMECNGSDHSPVCAKKEKAFDRMYDFAKGYRALAIANHDRYPHALKPRAIEFAWRQTVLSHPDWSRWKEDFVSIANGTRGRG